MSWSSKKQRSVVRSSTEAECQAIVTTTFEAQWVHSLYFKSCRFLPLHLFYVVTILVSTYTSSNHIYHSKTKHIEIDLHFVLQLVSEGSIRVAHISSKNQLVDLLTKAIYKHSFQHN